MKSWWDSLNKETAAYVLAAVILIAWLITIFLHYQEVSTLTNVVMIIVGYIWGSSTGSKQKDGPLMTKGSASSETTTTTTATTDKPKEI